MGDESVKLFGYWASPFALRVKWALKIKGIEYDHVEEDLPNKSSLLLQYNPVHKKIPVLVHNGKPVVESLVILEYINETWKHNPLMPEDPYERAMLRFWAKFADDKCVPAMMSAFMKKGEEKERAAEEARENLKLFESGFGIYFAGENIKFLDIAIGWIGCWARIVQKIAEIKLIDAETMPRLSAWFDSFLQIPIIKECMPPQDKLMEHIINYHKILTSGST